MSKSKALLKTSLVGGLLLIFNFVALAHDSDQITQLQGPPMTHSYRGTITGLNECSGHHQPELLILS